jgi:hypothetical protein
MIASSLTKACPKGEGKARRISFARLNQDSDEHNIPF